MVQANAQHAGEQDNGVLFVVEPAFVIIVLMEIAIIVMEAERLHVAIVMVVEHVRPVADQDGIFILITHVLHAMEIKSANNAMELRRRIVADAMAVEIVDSAMALENVLNVKEILDAANVMAVQIV